jgi:uncharacterized protein (TIGR03083 family)
MTTNLHPIDASLIESIQRDEAPALAREEYRRFADALASLDDADWTRPTDCDDWTVRDLVGHVVGEMRAAASIREQISQQREIRTRTKRSGSSMVDAMTATQIARTADLSTSEIIAEARALGEPATAGRAKTPGLARRLVTIQVDMGTLSERWKLGYLVDIILTRDVFMHRTDLARAVGQDRGTDATHDGRLVADIVGEWARRHGRPFDLTLTGPAGGRFAQAGDLPEVIEMDAVEFCRTLSGRVTPAPGSLLVHEVPF